MNNIFQFGFHYTVAGYDIYLGEILLAVVVVAPWAFVGFDTIPQAAEEFKFSAKKTKVIMVISIIFGTAVYAILNTVTAMVVPEGYASWNEYIDDMPNLTGLMSLSTYNESHTNICNSGLVLHGFEVLAAILSGIIGTILAIGFMVLLFVPIPMFNCSLGKESYIYLIIWIVLGVIFYLTSRKNKKVNFGD